MKKPARIMTVAAVWLLSLLIVGVTVRNLRTEQYRSEAAKHLQPCLSASKLPIQRWCFCSVSLILEIAGCRRLRS